MITVYVFRPSNPSKDYHEIENVGGYMYSLESPTETYEVGELQFESQEGLDNFFRDEISKEVYEEGEAALEQSEYRYCMRAEDSDRGEA